ncbi:MULTISPECIES: hypothetical protein [unclassified Microcoleus]|uniref:hypothetical protein n=1 Tax=unclassified Microcoleus TaxID=2642155 RepID=UPI002FCE9EB2
MKIMGHHTEEVIDEAARIQIEVDKIFETARSNNWSLEQFAIKVLAGATDYELGYFSIAAQLVQNVTKLDGQSSINILNYLLYKVRQLDPLKIKQAQNILFQGLVINKQETEQRLAEKRRN